MSSGSYKSLFDIGFANAQGDHSLSDLLLLFRIYGKRSHRVRLAEHIEDHKEALGQSHILGTRMGYACSSVWSGLLLLSDIMKKSKWPDFIVTVAFRFIGGMILGCGAGMILTYRVVLRAFSRNHITAPLILLGVCGLVGGIIAVCKTPYWQTPWYKGMDDKEDEMARAFLHQNRRTPPPSTRS